MSLRGGQDIPHEHSPGHGANAAGNRGNVGRLRLHGGKIHIPAELSGLVPIHGHVNDHCAILQMQIPEPVRSKTKDLER